MVYEIRRAAVIGSGTMGGAIAAHLANAGIPVDLFDIAPREMTPEEQSKGHSLTDSVVRNRIVNKGWEAQVKARPAALMSVENAALVRRGNLEDNLDWIKQADWILEVVVENLPIKQALMERLEAVRKSGAIIATNTSGLLIHEIASQRSEEFQKHFLGMHFFNPPRYLKLLEIIPTPKTSPDVIAAMSLFGEETLGKGPVLCKDTPNFIANRFASAAGAFEVAYAIDHGYTVEEIDALCGPLIGRPRTAVFRLLDLIGLDIMAHVNSNLYDAIEGDESRELLHHEKMLTLMQTMLDKGWLGNKAKQGFYKRVGSEFHVLDLNTLEYIPPTKVRFDSVGANRKIEPTGARIKTMVEAIDRAGEYIRNAIYHRLTYAARRIPEIADDILSIDNAIRWGFAHEMGPFEEWDALGVADSISKMEAAGFPVAGWVKDMLAAGITCFYKVEGGAPTAYYDIASQKYVSLKLKDSHLKVSVLKAAGKEVASNADASLIDMGDGVALFEIHSKANTLTPAVIQMGWQAIEKLGTQFDGLVIGNQGELFCGGANLDMQAIQQAASDQKITPAQVVENLTNDFQQMMLGLRYAPRPVVAAPFDRALGGGSELVLCADRIVAHAELYIGQTEAGLGLLPASGGCKELLRRIVNPVMRVPNADVLPHLAKVFENIGLAKFSTSAAEAREMGFLAPADRIVFSRDALLFEAKQEAIYMWQGGYRPPLREKIYAAGRDALSALRVQLFMLRDGGYASEHDVKVGEKIGWVLCGGDLSEPAWVDEQYILDLERAAFIELMQEPKTVERIMALLTTGKFIRN
jgi:3-hydroxyacyl-CoA dehydrogenase